jgi:tetratricopeptide (TPR) repeat protein
MDGPAGELAVRAIAPLARFWWICFLWSGPAIQADAPLARVAGFASFGRSLSNVVVSADKLQVLRFAQDDKTPGVVPGLPTRTPSPMISALAYLKLGNNDLAQQMLRRCIQAARRPEADAQNYYIAGMAERYSGNKEHAQADFQRALTLDLGMWLARVATAEMNHAREISDIP